LFCESLDQASRDDFCRFAQLLATHDDFDAVAARAASGEFWSKRGLGLTARADRQLAVGSTRITTAPSLDLYSLAWHRAVAQSQADCGLSREDWRSTSLVDSRLWSLRSSPTDKSRLLSPVTEPADGAFVCEYRRVKLAASARYIQVRYFDRLPRGKACLLSFRQPRIYYNRSDR